MGGLGYTRETLVDLLPALARLDDRRGSLEMLRNRLAESIFERRFSQRPPRMAAGDTTVS
jgi:hypothetical protein